MGIADMVRYGAACSLGKELLRAAGVDTEGDAVAVGVEEYDLVMVRKVLTDGVMADDLSEAELAVAMRDGIPHALKAEDLGTEAASLVQVLADAGVFKSRAEARRLVVQGGVSINGKKTTDFARTLSASDVNDGVIVLRKGSASYVVVRVAEAT